MGRLRCDFSSLAIKSSILFVRNQLAFSFAFVHLIARRPPFAVDIKTTKTQLLHFNLFRLEWNVEADMLLVVCVGSYQRTVNCSWEAVRLPKLTEHISCRALPSPRFALSSPVLKDARRLDVAYNSTEISIIFVPKYYSGIFPNGTYYLSPSTVLLLLLLSLLFDSRFS